MVGSIDEADTRAFRRSLAPGAGRELATPDRNGTFLVQPKLPIDSRKSFPRLLNSRANSHANMALISSATIIRSLAIFHLTIAYFLLTSPSKIVDQNLVYILGAAMDLVFPPFETLTSSF